MRYSVLYLLSSNPPPGYEVYEALYDYTAISSDDLTIRQGDELEVVEGPASGEKWWRAHNKTTGKIGYVPSNFVKKRRVKEHRQGKTTER